MSLPAIETEGTTLVDVDRWIRVERSRLQGSRAEPDDVAEGTSASNQRPVGADDAVEHGGEDVTAFGETEDGFYVAEDGRGIPEEEREHVFEPGYSTAANGTGFGLSIVRQIVEQHGGEVRIVESDTGGARFEVTDVEFVD